MNSFQHELGYFPQMPLSDKHLSSELSSDFTLPDYKSEIRRLLSTTATVIPPSEYFGNGGAQLDGDVLYKILYLGADGELYSVTLSDKYSFKIPLEFGFHNVNPEEMTLFSSVDAESVNARVLGPRKLNIRTKLTSHALALSPELRTPNLVGAHNSAKLQNFTLDTDCINIKKCKSETEIISDFIPINSPSESTRIVNCATNVAISECVCGEDKINVRGEIIIKLLYCDDTQSVMPIAASHKIPFTKSIPCEGVKNSFEASSFGIITDEQLDVAENGVGIELSLSIYAHAQANDRVSYIADSYSTEKHTNTSYSSLNVINSLRCTNGNLTQNDRFSLENINMPRDAKIVDVASNATVEELNCENGRIFVKGRCDHQLIYHHDGEFACKDLRTPFKYEVDCKGDFTHNSPIKWDARVGVPVSKARCDVEHLYLDCELTFDICIRNEQDIELLSEMSFGESRNNASNELVLCYPDRDATLWSIAKHYGTEIEKIKKRNSLPDGDGAIKRRFLVV